MKLQLLCLMAITSFSSFASDALVAKNLEGKYELVKEIKGNCDNEISVGVSSAGVYAEGYYSSTAFFSSKEGCKSKDGEMSGLEVNCTKFSKKSASVSSTEPLTWLGYMGHKTSLSLNYKGDKLTYEKNSTAVPVGIIVDVPSDFKCVYKKIN